MKISFIVAGDPVAQPRQRHRLIKAKNGREFVHNYTPADAPVNAWKEALFIEAKRHKPFEPLAGAVRCKIVFTFRRPKSHFISKGLLRDDAPFHRKSKPDLDNLAKAVMDVLTQVGYWRDDAQIVELSLMKMYATEYAECQEYPGAYIEVETVCDWDEK